MSVRTYEFGCKPPVLNAGKAMEQLRLANAAWNSMAKQRRLNQEQWCAKRAELCPELVALEGEVLQLKDSLKVAKGEIADYRKRNRTRKAPVEMIEVRDACIQKLNVAYARLKELKDETKETFSKELDVVSNEGEARLKAVAAEYQKEHKLYSPTKGEVMASVKKAKKLGFRKFDGTGMLAIQDNQNVCPTFADLCDGKWKDIQLDLQPWKKGFRGHVSLCIGRFGAPTFVTLPIILHRPIPAQAIVKRVRILRKRIGGNMKWFCQFVLNDNGSGCFDKPKGKDGCVAIDLGWRAKDEGLSAVTWVGSDGHGGKEVLPVYFRTGFKKVEILASLRSTNFNEIVVFIRDYIKTASLVPTWLQEIASHIHLWKSHNRVQQLFAEWQRYDGDEFIYARVSEYCKQDRHNFLHQEGLRSKLRRRREYWYRCLAAMLRKRYAHVLMDGIDLAKLQSDDDNKVAKRNKNIVCPSTLKQWLEGDKVSCKDTTRTCCFCGHINPKNSNEFLQCQACSKSYDRDVNACLVMLARAGVAPKMTPLLAAFIRQEVTTTTEHITDIVFPSKTGPLAELVKKVSVETICDDAIAEPVQSAS